MSTNIQLYVTYQQVSVFDGTLSNPFNAWSDLHVAQGFSWRKGRVAFGTLEPDGHIEIEIRSDEKPAPSRNVVRAIVVPFEAPPDGKIEIATITESQVLSISNDVKGILFEAGIEGCRDRYRITFIKGATPTPKILIVDAELSPPSEYRMETEPG